MFHRRSICWYGINEPITSEIRFPANPGKRVDIAVFNKVTFLSVLFASNEADLWDIIKTDDNKFDFSTIYRLKSRWCQIHGTEFCDKILQLDKS